jgi:RNA polymerase sigma factor for flagellar operon FliA
VKPAEATEGLRLLVDGQRAEAAEWRRFRAARSTEARAALFERYRSFAERAAKSEHRRIRDMGLDLDDCAHLAFEAVLSSIERFDPDRAIPFPAFARPRIRGAIHSALAKANEARAVYSARQRAERDRLASLKRHAVEAASDEPIETLRVIVVGMALGFMLDDSAQGEAMQVPSDAPSAYDSVVWAQTIGAMEAKLGTLPERERLVIEYHYRQGLRFAEIATLLGVSRGRISQIHSGALARLRKSLAKFR